MIVPLLSKRYWWEVLEGVIRPVNVAESRVPIAAVPPFAAKLERSTAPV